MSRSSPIFVLLVESDPKHAQRMTNALQELVDYDVVVHLAATVQEAIDRTKEIRFDGVFLNLHLSDSDGIETLIRMAPATFTSSVVAMSDQEDKSLKQTAQEVGFSHYMHTTQTKNEDIALVVGQLVQTAQTKHKLQPLQWWPSVEGSDLMPEPHQLPVENHSNY